MISFRRSRQLVALSIAAALALSCTDDDEPLVEAEGCGDGPPLMSCEANPDEMAEIANSCWLRLKSGETLTEGSNYCLARPVGSVYLEATDSDPIILSPESCSGVSGCTSQSVALDEAVVDLSSVDGANPDARREAVVARLEESLASLNSSALRGAHFRWSHLASDRWSVLTADIHRSEGESEESFRLRRLRALPELLQQLRAADVRVEPNWIWQQTAINANDTYAPTGGGPSDPNAFFDQRGLHAINLDDDWWLSKAGSPARVVVIDDDFFVEDRESSSPASCGDVSELPLCGGNPSLTAVGDIDLDFCGRCFGDCQESGMSPDEASRNVWGGFKSTTQHGAAVTALIGAETNNDCAMASVAADNAFVIPVRVPLYDRTCTGATSGLSGAGMIEALEWATGEGDADVVVITSYTSCLSPFALEAIKQAQEQLFVVAAGNRDVDLTLEPEFPAALDFDHLLTVGGSMIDAPNDTDEDEVFSHVTRWIDGSEGSNHGEFLDLYAPATGLKNAWNPLGNAGTSWSAPLVAGVAALLKADKPEASALDLRCAIIEGATKPDSSPDNELDKPLLNQSGALNWPSSCLACSRCTEDPQSLTCDPNHCVEIDGPDDSLEPEDE